MESLLPATGRPARSLASFARNAGACCRDVLRESVCRRGWRARVQVVTSGEYTVPMTSGRFAVALLSLAAAYAQAPPSASRADAAFEKYWAAESPAKAAQAADEIAKTGVSFDEALRRLKAGRTYEAQKTGVLQLSNRTSDGIEHFYAVNVPVSY